MLDVPAGGGFRDQAGLLLNAWKKTEKKIDFTDGSKTPKKEVLKKRRIKKSCPSPRFFFFVAFPSYFSFAFDGNRFRLAI